MSNRLGIQHFAPFLALLFALSVWAPGEFPSLPPERADTGRETRKIRLLMVGDALLHENVYEGARFPDGSYRFGGALKAIAPLLKTHGLAFYNQESMLAGEKIGLSTYPCFNSPQSFGDEMTRLGFNLVSLANNHTLDRGERGVTTSTTYWKSKPGVIAAGSYASAAEREEIRIGERNGISYSLLSYTYGTNGIPVPEGKDYLVNLIDRATIKADVERVRPLVDLLLVSVHWGSEYTHVPTKAQRELANYLADLGVDVVIGHHSHVVQPVARIGKTLVIYSLGNFYSGQVGSERRTAMAISAEIEKSGGIGERAPVTVRDPVIDFFYSLPERAKTPPAPGKRAAHGVRLAALGATEEALPQALALARERAAAVALKPTGAGTPAGTVGTIPGANIPVTPKMASASKAPRL